MIAFNPRAVLQHGAFPLAVRGSGRLSAPLRSPSWLPAFSGLGAGKDRGVLMIWVVQLSGWSLGCLLPFLSFSPSQRGSGMTGIPAPGELAWAPIYENQVPGLQGTGTGPSPHTLTPPRSPGAGALPVRGRGFTIPEGSGALLGSRLLFLSLPAASRRATGEGIGWGSRTSPDRSVRLLSVSNGGQGRERRRGRTAGETEESGGEECNAGLV